MTIELVDGKAGTPHINSTDKAIIHQAKFGSGSYVYDWGDGMSCTMQSANKAIIGKGCASIQGLDWHITDPEVVTIDSGSSGYKRNDIIAAKYTRNSSTDIETVTLTVLKGSTYAGTTAYDPTVPSSRILDNSLTAYQPLWRIPLDGVTVGTPQCMFTRRTALWDEPVCYTTNANWDVNYRSAIIGKTLIIAFKAVRINSAWNAAKEWEMSQILQLPDEMSTAFEIHNACISNSSIGLHGVCVTASGNALSLRSTGKMTIGVKGWVEGNIVIPV